MKRLITFLLLLYGSVSYGQTFDSLKLIKNELYGQKHKRWQVDSQMIIPKTGDTLVKAPGQLKIIGNSFAYTGLDRHWHISSITTGITTESDPVFLASPAFSITNTDITNWNSKIDASALTPYLTSAIAASTYQPIGSYLTNITGLVTPGTNINITGSGTSASPYVINSTSSGGVTSFNSRSGAVTSQFSDYSAYYQPIGRYIDSLRRVGTTVSALINGAWIDQYTDSVGSGGSGSGSPAGSSYQLQFNNAGAFGASANMAYDNQNALLLYGIRPDTATAVGAGPVQKGGDVGLIVRNSTATNASTILLENITSRRFGWAMSATPSGTFSISNRVLSGGTNPFSLDSTGIATFRSDIRTPAYFNLGLASGVYALHLGTSSYTTSNYKVADVGGTTLINSTSGSDIRFRIANAEKAAIAATGEFEIGTTTPLANAKLNVVSTTQGVLIPRVTSTELAAITKTLTSVTATGGTGYTSGSSLIFTGGGGSGAVGTIAVTAGVINGAVITNWGSGYTSAPTVTVSGSGSGATLSATYGYMGGLSFYCTDCTATDASTGVQVTGNGTTTWKNNW